MNAKLVKNEIIDDIEAIKVMLMVYTTDTHEYLNLSVSELIRGVRRSLTSATLDIEALIQEGHMPEINGDYLIETLMFANSELVRTNTIDVKLLKDTITQFESVFNQTTIK